MDIQEYELTTDSLPYLYQSDFYNLGFNKRGFYLDSNGNQYHYSILESDYFPIINKVDYELNNDSEHDTTEQPDDKIELLGVNTIKPSELFSKLNLCELTQSDLGLELTKEVIADLQNAPMVHSDIYIYDSGWRTKSILVYMPDLDVYRRIILSETGNNNRLNQSKYTSEILDLLKES